MRRTVMLATVISAAGLAAGAALASTGAAQAPGPPTGTKQLVVRQSSFKVLDHPPRRRGDGPPSAGDASILRYRVFDATGETRLGRMSAICVSTVRPTNQRDQDVQCTSTLTLRDGAIMLEGPGNPLAVTGGTGAYAGARGTAEGQDRNGQTTLTLTFMP
jgi:hypothetical protein